MHIEQFYDEPLAHASYAIVSDGKMAIIDPERNPQQYYSFADEQNAEIIAVIETHPHADFVSSHAQIHDEKGATIYTSSKVGADYPYQPFDGGDIIEVGSIKLESLYTPGHSPDSISIVAINENGDKEAVFTGDSLFIGDCGRPDLREKAGNIKSKRLELAKMMYHTLRDKFMNLPDETKVYPAHGAGSLCGKNLSDKRLSTIGTEKAQNWSMQEMTEEEFTDELLDGQPFIPHYFIHSVNINKEGAPSLDKVLKSVKRVDSIDDTDDLIIDTRSEQAFKNGHNENAINIQYSPTAKFETWLGAVVKPSEKFHVIAADEDSREAVLERICKIGYEGNIISAAVKASKSKKDPKFDKSQFKTHVDNYSIVDIRQPGEFEEEKYFNQAVNIPLSELRDRAEEVNTDKPVVVHCAGGYRSATGASILQKQYPDVEVIDMSTDIEELKESATVVS